MILGSAIYTVINFVNTTCIPSTIIHYLKNLEPMLGIWAIQVWFHFYGLIIIILYMTIFQWIHLFINESVTLSTDFLLCISSYKPDFFFPGCRTIWIYSCMDGVIIHDTENFHYIHWSLNPVNIGYNAFERIDNRIESNISCIFNIFPFFQSIECIYIYPYFFISYFQRSIILFY